MIAILRLFILVTFLCHVGKTLPLSCLTLSNTPLKINYSANEKDDGFELRIRRTSDGAMVGGWFEAGQEYNVELSNGLPFVNFQNFLIWLSPKNESKNLSDQDNLARSPLGNWVHLSGRQRQRGYSNRFHSIAATKERAGCMGVVAEKRDVRRGLNFLRVLLKWQAPQIPFFGTDGCVKIRAIVQSHATEWRETGGLVKILCPSVMRPFEPVLPEDEESILNDTHQSDPPIQNPPGMRPRDMMQSSDCCACGTATYRLVFEGLWNRTTHPRDWPVNHPNLLHWTNLIGASHSPSFQIYTMGQPASAGVQSVCAYGDTTILRQALTLAASKSEGSANVPIGSQSASIEISPLRSLISTPGMWGEETLNEHRATLLSVNRTHPIISLVTMLGPSPDWCTGISGQSVCKADCTWEKKIRINLYPWDAGIRNGNTYMPKNADRNDLPDAIRYIDESWMPGNPFFENKPVARLTLERVLPKADWECTNQVADGVSLFEMGGGIQVVGQKHTKKKNGEYSVQTGQKLSKKGGSKSVGFGGPGGSGTIGTNNPLSDPSLAQMATFLCITDDWSAWGPCSVTCGVGSRVRRRNILQNKKPELCAHVPLIMEESCEGRKRTCDFTSPCSLLPWTAWTPCNATCEFPNAGYQSRKRSLVRPRENGCDHVFKTTAELSSKSIVDERPCQVSSEICDPATICGEGPREGYPCGFPVLSFYYSAIEHDCLPFNYLGCKGGRNRFEDRMQCLGFCKHIVEALPAWRRERMGLLQFKSSQLRSAPSEMMMQAAACFQPLNTGEECIPLAPSENYWYFSPRTGRCHDFVFLGCNGNENKFTNHTSCMAACMPNELSTFQQLSKMRKVAMPKKIHEGYSTKTEDSLLMDRQNVSEHETSSNMESAASPKQDCRVTSWGYWGPCSSNCLSEEGFQIRNRAIQRPSRYGGKPCGSLFDKRICIGENAAC